MVINLVDNAIKYTQKGSHIDIRTERRKKCRNLKLQMTDLEFPMK